MEMSRADIKPSNEEIKTLFDAVAPRYDAITHSYALRRRVEFFVHHAEGDCLEVGAGTGEIARALKQLDHHVMATDISPQMVSQIRNKLGIEAFVCDAESLPFSDASFNTVIGAEMIYYLDYPDRFLSEAYRVLRPNGRLLLSSANASIARFYDRLRALFRAVGIGHGTYFDDPVRTFPTSKKLILLLQHAGFEIRAIQKTVVLPVSAFDWLNRISEKTLLKHFGVFLFVTAEKI